jgi:hypothetical protein
VKISILIVIFSILAGLVSGCDPEARQTGNGSIDRAFDQQARDAQVSGEGAVARILSDDTSGSPHQRFVIRLSSGRTVLIQHNIELAPRIDDLNVGDSISFSGEYIWNEQGGLVHWTHHDPAGKHKGGWIKHGGKLFR